MMHHRICRAEEEASADQELRTKSAIGDERC